MALKDWKKVGKDHWENKIEDESEVKIESAYKKEYVVFTLAPTDSTTNFSKWRHKYFKTKKQALAYAKAYMRKH